MTDAVALFVVFTAAGVALTAATAYVVIWLGVGIE